jgi:hypothetical protein
VPRRSAHDRTDDGTNGEAADGGPHGAAEIQESALGPAGHAKADNEPDQRSRHSPRPGVPPSHQHRVDVELKPGQGFSKKIRFKRG